MSSVGSLKASFITPPSETTIYLSVAGTNQELIERALSCITFEEANEFRLISIDRKPNLVNIVVVMEKEK